MSTRELLRNNLLRRIRGIAATASSLVHPVRAFGRAYTLWPAVREVFGEARAPRTSLNRPIGQGRRMAFVRRSLAATKDIAHSADATVNDVVLAAVAGGLRDVLSARGEPVDGRVLRISVPVSLHRPSRAARGNLVSPMAVPVQVGEADAARRLRAIADATAVSRLRPRPQVFTGMPGSHLVQRIVMRLMRRQRMINACVANVVGPSDPLSLAGVETSGSLSLGPDHRQRDPGSRFSPTLGS